MPVRMSRYFLRGYVSTVRALKGKLTCAILFVSVLVCSTCQAVPPEFVAASDYGFNSVDATSALQDAIDTGAKVVLVQNMGTDWIIRPVFLNSSNQEIVFEEGVVVTAKEGEFHGHADSLFSGWDRDNLTITGYGATVQMRKQDYMNPPYAWSEARMAFRLYSCSNLLIQGLTIKDTGGDAVYLGVNVAPSYNSNVVLRDLFCDNNLRQGISVISVENLLIDNCILRDTGGQSPQSGIDFEPDYDYNRLINCIVRNCVFESNRTCGVLLNIWPYVDADAVSGSVENCTFIGNYIYGMKYRLPLPNWTTKDCIFVDNGHQSYSYPGVGVYVENENPDHPGMNETIDYSAFYGNAEGEISGYVALGPGCVTNQTPVFKSTDVADPCYMHLADNCPVEIAQGASDGGHMGARLRPKYGAVHSVIFRQYHLADGTPDTLNGYQDSASLALATSSPDTDSSTEAFAWIADDFSAASGSASMMLLRFANLFGSGPIQVPPDAKIIVALLKVNVYDRYLIPPSLIQCHTGLTDWYTTYQQSDFSTSAWRQHDSGVAWDGGSVADHPRTGLDYRATSIDIPFDPTGSASLGDFITVDVTVDVKAYQKGALANNGWWFGTNQAQTLGRYQLATVHSVWDLKPSLRILWAVPRPCSSVPDEDINIADVNRDCRVDLLDLGIFADNWLDCVDPQGCL